MGMPSGDTTSRVCPPMLTVSVMWLSAGPVCATSRAYSGAARHMATITRNTVPKASAVRSRRSRRNASLYGPAAATGREVMGKPAAAPVGEGARCSWHREPARYFFSCQVDQSFR